MNNKKRGVGVLALVLLVCALLSACKKDKTESGTVRINEAMASNRTAYTAADGSHPDWIELYNEKERDADLTGWSITDDSADAGKFTFTGGTVPGHGYLLLFADKSAAAEGGADGAHLNFGLSAKKGESLYLFDSDGNLVSRLQFPAMDADVSCGVSGGKTGLLETPTPGKGNSALKTEDAAEAVQADAPANSDVVINEYATSDTRTLIGPDGDFTGWVELYNRGDAAVALGGFALTDDETQPQRWVLPDCTIDGHGYLLIDLTGEECADPLCAPFKLGGKEEALLLFDPQGTLIDRCAVFDLFGNLTCGRTPDGGDAFAFFASATPGKANDKQGFDSVDTAARTDSKELVITEVSAVNLSAKAPDGKAYDYIELYNAADRALDLGSFRLSDSKDAARFVSLPKQKLAPGAYAVVYCTETPVSGALTADLGLNRAGETVYLADKSGAVLDALTYHRLAAGQSCGRALTGDDTPVYFQSLTPGEANPDTVLSGAIANPAFSIGSTYVKKGTAVEILCDDAVYYTTDGSTPTKNSAKYTEPLTIRQTTVVRARAYRAGALPSDVVTATYLVEKKHTLPVVFLATDEKNLYSEDRGIWATGSGASGEFPYLGANFWQDWERPVHFEFMTTDGVSQVAFDAGMKVFGQYSRAEPQKSVSIRLRDRYGPKEVCYPFFEGNDVNVFSSLVLRNSGQDIKNAHLRDAFCAMVLKGQMDVDIMDYRPVAVYVNGKYHGIYDLREKIDADYLNNHHGLDADNVDMIKGARRVQLGTIDRYQALIDYIKTHDPADAKVYKYLQTQIDIDELICYWMAESFFNNTDTGNIRFYRGHGDGDKWRWIFFDVDWALFPSTYTRNGIAAYLNPQGHGVGKAFSTTIMVRLMRNKDFRTRVLELHRQHLETTFDTARMLKLFDAMVEEIDAEMKRHTARWPSLSYESWRRNVATLRGIIEKAPGLFIGHMKTTFNMTAAEQKKYLPQG
ncbi:MAG: lamin tail domain-containing protein [Clostridia bacterium]|nr:lamin tail domain-containing protein [Clostridia bacterium]